MIGQVHVVLLVASAAIASHTTSLQGIFALQSGEAKTQGHMIATQVGSSPLRQRLDLWLTRGGSRTVDRYSVDMTKYLHLIAIGDDFTTFEHIHPTLAPDGHFSIVASFPKPEVYHIYADSDPQGLGQQVFRYDLPVGADASSARSLDATGDSVRVDGYRVTLGSTTLRAGAESEIEVHVTKNGAPARDLHAYLGALAHAVFIDAVDLSYAHVHPMALGAGAVDSMSGMSGMSVMGDMASMPGMLATPIPSDRVTSPAMLLHVRVQRPGVYKLWLQFKSTTGLHVAPFVLRAA